MSITPPPPIDPAPTPGPQRGQKVTFSDRVDALVTWWQNSPAQLAALATNMWNNATETYNRALEAVQAAADAASSAAAAAASSTAVKWVSGALYADGDVVWSPMDHLPYRRIGAGGGTTDPKLDSGNWAIQLFAIGLGGQTIGTSISLVSSSPAAITVTPIGPGYYAILPDSTTCPKGASLFFIYNAGDFDYGIKDAAGVQIGWVRPNTGVQIGLSVNTTAAGVWATSGTAKIGVTAAFSSTAISADGATLSRVAIDSTRSFFLFGNLYGVVYDSSTGLWGSPALIRSGGFSAQAVAVLSGSNQILVCSAVTTAYEAVTITVSGTGLTVNAGTKATATLSAAISAIGALLAAGSGFAHSYSTSSNGQIRGLSVSGTTPTISAAVNHNLNAPNLFITGSVARVVGRSGSNVVCAPYTISGSSTPVAGTPASTPSETATSGSRAFMNGNGNIVAIFRTAPSQYPGAAVFKLTGTVEAVTAVTFAGPSISVVTGDSDHIAITNSKTALIFASTSSDNVHIELLTDTAGVASSGSALQFALPGSSSPAALALAGTTARFNVSAPGSNYQLSVDCSTSSPSLIGVQAVHKSIGGPGSSRADGLRDYRRLEAGGNSYSTASTGNASGADGMFTSANVRALGAVAASFQAGYPGVAANETWGLEQLGAFGSTIKRLEACA